MRINHTVIFGGIIVVFVATIIGLAVVQDIQGIMAVIGFGTMLIMQFLNLLKQDKDTQEVKQEAKVVVQTVTNAATSQGEKLKDISQTVETVAKQTNGDLTRKLEMIHEDVKATAGQNETIIKEVKEVKEAKH